MSRENAAPVIEVEYIEGALTCPKCKGNLTGAPIHCKFNTIVYLIGAPAHTRRLAFAHCDTCDLMYAVEDL